MRADELYDEEFVSKRRERVEPELTRIRQWLENEREQVVPSTLLGKALAYTLEHWDALTRYLDYVELTPDNNIAEQRIRSFVVGGKNCLM